MSEDKIKSAKKLFARRVPPRKAASYRGGGALSMYSGVHAALVGTLCPLFERYPSMDQAIRKVVAEAAKKHSIQLEVVKHTAIKRVFVLLPRR